MPVGKKKTRFRVVRVARNELDGRWDPLGRHMGPVTAERLMDRGRPELPDFQGIQDMGGATRSVQACQVGQFQCRSTRHSSFERRSASVAPSIYLYLITVLDGTHGMYYIRSGSEWRHGGEIGHR